MSQRYDYIIAGAGAAGLSLVYHLVRAGLGDKRVLLVDRERKTHNDRTWCFWEKGEGPFEPLVFRRWPKVWFHGEGISECLDLAPYRYKMIRGIDFYTFMDRWLYTQPQITRLYGAVGAVEEGRVWVDGEPYQAEWVFDSIYRPAPRRPAYHYLLQHFKGWVVESPGPVFDPGAATFMDFRLEQQGAVRFAYVLPYDERTALVEYTLFSPALLQPEEYDRGLQDYLERFLHLRDYTVQHEEFGVIPMTDAPFEAHPSPWVVPIGTAGGRTKASTGYTFQRIQHHSRQIAENLARYGKPLGDKPGFDRHYWMDSLFLNALSKGREEGRAFFSRLFRQRPVAQVLRFLDEETSLAEDLRLMTAVNVPAFLAAGWDVMASRLKARFWPAPGRP